MTRLFLAATASLALFAGCDRSSTISEKEAGNSQVAQNAGSDADATLAAAPLGQKVDRDRALVLMHDRHEGMEDIGDAMKRISRELKNETPDIDAVRSQATTIAQLAPQVTGWFPPGTGPEIDDDTHAMAEIWQKPEDFAAKRNGFQQAARSFNAAAQGLDLAAIRAAHSELGKSCKSCHDSYREKDD